MIYTGPTQLALQDLTQHSGSHGQMTGHMLAEIERALLEHEPDRVLVYGDTNSTLAGAFAAAKLHFPVAHVAAGPRSFNMRMPEEINRILTDQLSDLLLCPTEAAVMNLNNEGFANRPVLVLQEGDVMQDSALLLAEQTAAPAGDLPKGFILATLYRAENTDNLERLAIIVAALNEINAILALLVLPLHPRTRKLIAQYGLELNVHFIDPVGYFEMVWLLDHCELVLNDSGGVQKEAFFFSKACVTMHDQTEWVELIEIGANELVGAVRKRIVDAVSRNLGRHVQDTEQLYGGGKAAERIVNELAKAGA
ncbi:UDP-N-acetylglucosamine 2-epimerase (non-hydrolyzing) [Marinobacterium sp. AK62]|uniref:UDP-N-acetylglucosamine 2-epimerase (Non-hydrolyzing) n=1 Tax=Marinobacterium alkalitolerans TaxID=1542925 RepID=A0ABS3ZGN3_9GAMM|nr:UDP-N-acetylglucosamine 2-epimerase (non-hydrolyzing) [Marinobacterium alkalitolerans]MBP0050159.1 UDP-N-acetylglucosamine 2-epimerase (non-hydrolyzing) [Marinobacterium alkalitolerans]